jgi:tetratricopeptide (TPR) repeat protein
MSIWQRLFGKSDSRKPKRLDYLNEAMALERQGDLTGAITSYRLGLRGNPNDLTILQNIAICFSKTGQVEEAIRHYRHALGIDGTLSGAHYGLAFLLLKKGEPDRAAEHLRAFLARPPRGPDAERWIRHAESTLEELGAAPAREPPDTA